MSHKKRVEALEKLANQRQKKEGQANPNKGYSSPLSGLSQDVCDLLSTIDPDVFRRAAIRELQERSHQTTDPQVPAPAPFDQTETRPGYHPK